MDGESSSSNGYKGTPVKALKRDVKGLLSIQQESPSQSDVLWKSLDSPMKSNHRTVGGKSKSLKSSNQLTPKNHITRKKYYSSPILVAKVSEDTKKEDLTNNKQIEDLRILEEFQKQFSNENYVPRNLLDNLTENLEDSVVMEANVEKCETKSDLYDQFSDYADISDLEFVDEAYLEEIEQKARELLDKNTKNESKEPTSKNGTSSNNGTSNIERSSKNETSSNNGTSSKNGKFSSNLTSGKNIASSANLTSNKNGTSSNCLKTQVPNETTKCNVRNYYATAPKEKVTQKNEYFDSDDDDLILSVPLDKLLAENYNANTLDSKKDQQTTNNNVKNNNLGKGNHTSVIPTKREYINVNSDKNRIQNQSNSKPPFVQSNSDTFGATLQEPSAKRRCTSEEIAEKKRQALLRREAYLQNLRSTQKSNK